MQQYLKLALASVILSACGTDTQTITKVTPCSVTQTSGGAQISCPGQAPIHISNGANGANGSNGVVALIDPCGDEPGHLDEVVLRLSSTSLVAYYRNGGYEHLAQLTLGGGYTTTDHQNCSFTVELNGTVTDQLGGSY